MARSRRSKDAPSEFFPGFTDVDEVGSGSIATVYRAQAHGTGRQVALKLITAPDLDPSQIAAAERELAVLGTLASHPHVVTLFRHFRLADGRLALVLELCRGSLRDLVNDGHGLPVADVVAAGVKIANALDAAHRLGLLHRDVAPGNIMITADGEPVLADFGLAGLRAPAAPSLDGAVHTAPELLDRQRATPASDVYGLASSLHQLIAGQPAFGTRAQESTAAMISRVLRDPVPPLAAAPPAVAAVLARAMAKDPAARSTGAAAFAADLAAALSAADAPAAAADRSFRSFRSLPTYLPPQPSPPQRPNTVDWSSPTLTQRTAEPDPQPPTPTPTPPAPTPPPTPPPPPPPPPRSVEPPSSPPAEQTVRRSMLPAEFWAAGATEPAGGTEPAGATPEPGADQAPDTDDDIAAAALAEMEAAARADLADAPVSPEPPAPQPAPDKLREKPPDELPEPPPPAEATVFRSTLPRAPEPPLAIPAPPLPPPPSLPLPAPPPAADATVARSSLAVVPPAPTSPPPGVEQTVFRSRPPQLPPTQAPDTTVLRSSLPVAPSYYPNAAPPQSYGVPPAAAGPVALDPSALARRVTLRSGRSSMIVDDSGLTLRAFLRKKQVGWNDISGFEARYDDPANPMTGGHLVATTRSGPVELPATKRAMADLRYTQALLEAYRLRAQAASGY